MKIEDYNLLRFTTGGITYTISDIDYEAETCTLSGNSGSPMRNYNFSNVKRNINSKAFSVIEGKGVQPPSPKYSYRALPSITYGMSYDESALPFTLTSNPTGNCQIQCIANFESISPYKKDRLEKLKKLWMNQGEHKNMLLIDIRTSSKSFVTELFSADDIVLEAPYKSTNSSSMTIFLVRTTLLNN